MPVAPGDVDVSVLVQGSAAPLTVKLLDPLGNLIGTGGVLISGFTASGLDAPVSTPGTYTAQILGLGLTDKVTVSIVRDSRVQ